MAKVAGTCYLTIDGENFSLKGNMTISIGGYERESVVGLDSYHGIMEKPRASFIECDLTHTGGLDVKRLENLTGVTVTVRLINGQAAVLSEATQTKAVEIKAETGELSVRFEGPQGDWLPSSATA